MIAALVIGAVAILFTASMTHASSAGCSLTLAITPDALASAPGAAARYSAVVKNIGRTACSDASITFHYADQEAFSSSSPEASASDYYWRISALALSDSFAVSVETQVKSGTAGSIMKTEACAAANNADSDACMETSRQVSVAVAPPAIPPTSHGAGENGTWIWDSPKKMSIYEYQSLLQDAARSGFNAVYVTVDDYLTLSSMPAGSAKDAAKLAYFQALSGFISYASGLGLAVDAEGGWKDWAQEGNRWKGYALIDMVREYNEKYPGSKIRNLQYDVEPYLLPTYEKNKAVTLKQFVEFIDESATRMKAVDAGFSVVVPHFYDSNQRWTPSFAYAGKTKHAFTHLLDALQKKPGSALIIMAYRDFVEGSNGSYEISAAEVKEASLGGYSSSVIVALETGNVSPAYVTYFGSAKQKVLDASDSLRSAFGGQAAFGGVSIHYLDTYLKLK